MAEGAEKAEMAEGAERAEEAEEQSDRNGNGKRAEGRRMEFSPPTSGKG